MGERREMVRELDEHTIEVSLPSKTGYERIAMECSASFARIAGFVQERIEDLKTAVSEACLNAMVHGNKGHREARVIVTMNFESDTFSVSVKDEGAGIPELPKDPDIEKKVNKLEPPKGFGIFLIKQLVDQVEFNQTTKEGHIVKMAIRLCQK
jgi:serine/threonine-protein kinase RsbW